MRKSYWMIAAAAVAVAACSDSAVGPNDGLTPTPEGAAVFDIIAGEFNIATNVVDSYQGSRMFIPGGLGYTPVMDGGAANDGTAPDGEPNRSDPNSVLSILDDNWFSLGLKASPEDDEGYIVVDFGMPQGGKMAVVWEQTFQTATYPTELADVYATNDLTEPVTWTYLGQVGNKGTTDPNCEGAGRSDCTYTLLDDVDQCFQYVKVANAISPDGYNDLAYVENGEIMNPPGVGNYPGNELIPDGFDVQAIAFESECVLGGGCTLTQGYWKTHSENGPAPYDATWAELASGASTPFFLSGQSYYDVLWTAPKGGNVYYILAHQWIAAYMNVLNGASIPTEVESAWNEAKAWFEATTPEQAAGLKGSDKAPWNAIAELLDDYNNGLVGPGHCSEASKDIL